MRPQVTSASVEPSTDTVALPPERGRKVVGMRTVTAIAGKATAGPANASTFTPTPSCTPASTSKVTLAGFAPLLLRLLPFYLLSGCYFCFRWFYFSAYAQSWPHFYSCFYANSPLFHFHSPRLPLLPLLPPHLQRL